MYILTYTMEGAAQVAAHLTEETATAQAATLQAAGVADVAQFGPVVPEEAENDTDYRLSQSGNYLLQERLRLAVLTRANYMLGWATNPSTLPAGETAPDELMTKAAKYAILNADQPQGWFPKLWVNFVATLRPDRTTVAGVDAWVKANWPVFAMLWADKL